MTRALVYVRVSTVEQVDNYSLDNQIHACLEYCSREHLDVLEVFREEGESAKTAERPRLRDLLNCCALRGRKDGITHVVVDRVDRLARNAADYSLIRRTLERLGIQVRAVRESFDDTPAGRLIENLMASLAQFENDTRAMRTRDGMMSGAAEGRWMWKPPLGYSATGAARGLPILAPDPGTAPLIREAFLLVGQGMAKTRALEILTRRGLRSRRGQALTPQSFGSLLKNPVYMARIVVPKWDFDGPGNFEAIVSPDEYRRAQRRDDSISDVHHKLDHPDFPLRRAVRCGYCSTPLTGSWSRGRSKRYPYYRCPRRGCGKSRVRKERLEELFERQLLSMGARAAALSLLGGVVQDAADAANRNLGAAREDLRSRLQSLSVKKDRLVDAFLQDSVIDRATYEEQLRRLNDERAAIEGKLASTGAEIVDAVTTFERATAVLADLAGYWRRLRWERRPAFLAATFPDGLVYTDESLGTAGRSWLFDVFTAEQPGNDHLAARTGFEPVPPP